MDPLISNYLGSVKKQFAYYRLLGNNTFDQLSDEDFFWQYNLESNSIAIIIKHLWGNMRSRWTDFFTTDGEKDFRHRDSEFELDHHNKEEILKKWNEGWDILFDALDGINKSNFNQLVYIRNQGHTITEAINRQLSHYAYHVGQIVYIGRMIKGKDWKSLSIPKGESKIYNSQKFEKDKSKGHFTDEFLKEDS